MSLNKITTCLWFDGQAEEAAQFYTSIFQNSKITHTSYYLEAGSEVHSRQPGSVSTVEFELNGHPFVGLNGGPLFKFNEAVSFQVDCASQDEIDYYWAKLGDGGDETKRRCGWLQDKFGVSWQVVPSVLKEMLRHEDKVKANRCMAAMMGMVKMDIEGLKRHFAGEGGP